jgi:hypothetical protein
MMKRLSLLLAVLFVGATLFAAPVIASGNGHNGNNNDNNDKVCVLSHHEDDHGKDYRWVWDIEDLHVGDKVVKDKYCDDDHNGNGDHNDGNQNGNHEGDHNGNHNGDHNGNDWS